MLILKITEDDLKYFNDLCNQYPDNVFIKKEYGFDMDLSVQIVIDVAGILEVMLPAILVAVEMALKYRIKENNINVKKQELLLKENELEFEKEKYLLEKARAERNEFEINLSSNGENKILVKTSDILKLRDDKDELKQFIQELQESIENGNGNV